MGPRTQSAYRHRGDTPAGEIEQLERGGTIRCELDRHAHHAADRVRMRSEQSEPGTGGRVNPHLRTEELGLVSMHTEPIPETTAGRDAAILELDPAGRVDDRVNDRDPVGA